MSFFTSLQSKARGLVHKIESHIPRKEAPSAAGTDAAADANASKEKGKEGVGNVKAEENANPKLEKRSPVGSEKHEQAASIGGQAQGVVSSPTHGDSVGFCSAYRLSSLPSHGLDTVPKLLDCASATDTVVTRPLAYIAVYDAPLNCDYAYICYQETGRSAPSTDWRVRIKGNQTAGAVFEPAQMISQARAASAQGKEWFQWGYELQPTEGDPRQVQFRVNVKDDKPHSIDIEVTMRKADHTKGESKIVTCKWPSAGKI